VLALAVRLASDFGCVGVVVDAKPGAVTFYQKLGFVALELVEGQSGMRPVPTAMLLPMAEVEAAVPPTPKRGRGRTGHGRTDRS
jgi:hypothetical protein